MLEDIKGRRILVTGASQGIGAAVAEVLGRLGAAVGVHFHSSVEAAQAVAHTIRKGGGTAALVSGDISDAMEARRIVEEAATALDGLDTLINIAGGPIRRVDISEIDEQLFDDVVDLNAKSVVLMTNAARPYLRKRQGSVINTVSYAAVTGSALALTYAGSKAYVGAATKSFALAYAADGIRVNAVSPGVIMTPFHQKNSSPEWLEKMKGSIPLGRIASADECVGVYAFLASNAMSGYITGQTININGGLSILG